MDNKRDRRREQTLDLLHAWTGIGVWVRMVLTIAAITGIGWLVLECVNLIIFTAITLRGY